MKRDITPPMRDPEPRARGGMTTRDPEAWAREVNTTGDHDSDRVHGDRKRQSKVRRARALRDADAVGLHVERAVAAGWDFARALDAFGQRLDGESAGRLRQHWIYGERFWAWWQGRQKPAKAPEPDAGHAAGAARARVPGDQIRTHTGWHTVTAAEHPAYPHVATESGMWFRGAILETRRKDEAKPTTLAAPPGCDPGGPARNVPIRVGDYVRARDKSGRCDFDFWARVTGVSDAASEYVKCVGLDPACEYHVPLSCVADHRPAPRIVLPDGRAVVPERMWRQRSEFGNLEIVQVEGRCFVHRPSESWEPADYWTRNVPDPNYYRRVWPPADVEGV